MNQGYHLTAIQKIRLKQEQERASKLKLQQSKLQKQRIYKRRRRVALIVLVLVFTFFIYLINLLFNDNSKSNALETTVSETSKKEVPVKKQVEQVVPVTTQISAENVIVPSEPSIYNENIPMPKEHQEYLYELCEERGLDYHKTLAVIQHESMFDPNATNETNDYGYFQVNLVNHKDLAKKLDTDNSPLNPYINMNWGTYMLADLYSYWGEQGFTGEQLDEVVWSSYNKGINGFRNYGHATTYIAKMKEAIQDINQAF